MKKSIFHSLSSKTIFPACRRGCYFLLTIFAIIFSSWLMFHTFSFNQQEQSMEIATKCWSDFGSHIPLIRSFSMGGNLAHIAQFRLPEYPIFPGEPIRYHFIFYVIVGLLEKAGLRIDWALNIPSIIGFSGLLILIGILSWKLFRSYSVSLLSIFFFLFNGSLSFLPFFQKNPISFHTAQDIVRNTAFPSFSPWDGGLVSAFWNLNIYTNQRHLAAAFALGLGFIALLLFLEKITGKKRLPYLCVTVPLLCLLPYFHQPMLIIIGLFMMWYFLVFPKLRIFLLLTGILSLGPVLLQLLFFAKDASNFAWYPRYLIHGHVTLLSFFTYWFHNLGLHMILIPIGFLMAPMKVKKVVFPMFILFCIANLFKFSVEIAANHKFFNFFMIFGNMLSAYSSVIIYKKIRTASKHWIIGLLDYLLIGLLCLFLILSGIIDFFVVVNDPKIPVPDIPQNKIATWIAANTPKDAIFLNSGYLYHPASIAGRSIFLGWPYFPWSAGYKENRMPIMKEMYESKDPHIFCPLFKKYTISYVTVEAVSGNPDLPTIEPSCFRSLAKPIVSFTRGSYDIYTTQSLCPSL